MSRFSMGNDIIEPAKQEREVRRHPDAGVACATDRPPGFIHGSAVDLHNSVERVNGCTARLNDLAARLMGAGALPRNQRDVIDHEKIERDTPRPVESDSERLISAQKRLYLAIDELEEIAQHLDQL